MNTAAVHRRIQPQIKEQAEAILQRPGSSPYPVPLVFRSPV